MEVVGWVCLLCIIYLGYIRLHLLAPALNITVTFLELCLLCLISSKKTSDQMNVGGCTPLSCSFFSLQSCYFPGHWNRNIVCQELSVVPQPVRDDGFCSGTLLLCLAAHRSQPLSQEAQKVLP